MERNHYDEICQILFDKNRMDLIKQLQETTGAHMANEIKQLKRLAATVANGNFNQAAVIAEAKQLIA